MQTVKFSCRVSSNRSSNINIKFQLDGKEICSITSPTQAVNVTHEIDDDESQHLLEIIMSGKTSDDTTISSDGTILDDTIVKIQNLEFDDINIDQLCYQHAEYHHDFNGIGDPTVSKFYGEIGCNGVISLKFTTPIYIWLLENM